MKIQALWTKWREIILYLIFGVLTTLVSLAIYTAAFAVAEHGFGLPLADKRSGVYMAVYVTAQILQWVGGVLFAFVTNKKWVFTDAREEPVWRQLAVFSGARVATFILDLLITYLGVLAFAALLPGARLDLGFIAMSAEFLAKAAASVVVVIVNYVLSKLLVFRR